jgi:hypothetical protein
LSKEPPRKIFANWLDAMEVGEKIEAIVKQALYDESLSRRELRECLIAIGDLLGTEGLPEE